jgi:hypothetical protein
MSAIGEVVRLAWPTVDGKVTLIAITSGPEPVQLTRIDCEEADVDGETERLYGALAGHRAATTGPQRRERNHTRRKVDTSAGGPARRLTLVR